MKIIHKIEDEIFLDVLQITRKKLLNETKIVYF